MNVDFKFANLAVGFVYIKYSKKAFYFLSNFF